MNRNKMNIKMDLLRTAKTALEINKPFDVKIAILFLNKAANELDKDFPSETELKKELTEYQSQIDGLHNDSLKRIRWGEKVMTIATRLGTL